MFKVNDKDFRMASFKLCWVSLLITLKQFTQK